MRILRRLPVLLAFAALAAGACGGGSSDAATVNGVAISDDSFRQELEFLSANEALEQRATDQGSLFKDSDGDLEPDVVATWLTEVLNAEIIAQAVEEEGVEVTDEDRADAEEGIVNLWGSQEVVDGFPEDFRATLVERQAQVVALSWHVAGGRTGTEVCARHILVSADEGPPGEAERARAQELADELQAGGDFDALARENSDDPGSAQQGGDLGCADPLGYVPPFREATLDQPIGEVGDPVETEFGYHVIRVDDRREAEADPTAVGNVFADWLSERRGNADVSVNGKYGELVNTPPQFYVAPPGDDSAPTTSPTFDPSQIPPGFGGDPGQLPSDVPLPPPSPDAGTGAPTPTEAPAPTG